jgi:hypothetical protein
VVVGIWKETKMPKGASEIAMTATEFETWVLDIKRARALHTYKAVQELMGVTYPTFLKFRNRGCDRMTALGCKALLAGMEV